MVSSYPADSRRFCQTLLNGSPTLSDLRAAEDLLQSVLRDEGPVEAFCAPWEPAIPPCCTDPANRRIGFRVLAPTLLLEGLWLARVAQSATAHQATENLLFELYCRLMGLNDPARSPPLRFRSRLIAEGVFLASVGNPGFFHERGLPDFALRFPCLHLCLLHRPRTFFPELLGYTLAHVYREPAWWEPPASGGISIAGEARALALAALDAYPCRDAEEGRIRAGWNLYRQLFDRLLRELEAYLARRATTEDAMADLVRAKRSRAIGYHGRILLGGRRLDDWLAEHDPRPLLRALRDSPAIDLSCPSASRLIHAMEFGGSMFGVFDREEQRVCLEWIEDPGRSASRETLVLPTAGDDVGLAPSPNARERTPPPGQRIGTRRLYAVLLHAESPSDCPAATDLFVRRVLRRTRWLNWLPPIRRPGFPYTPKAFHDYIEAVHRHEVDRYRAPLAPPGISREFCRWAALQLAPAILVDGCWLAGIATAAEKLGATGRPLLAIYADELGNGVLERNHPNVYRRLLESLGYDLPDFRSEAFANHSGFLEAAFDIPVYLLAIGLRSERYFPELLGLNLAIELSGLGAGYMQAIDLLRHHGIDPTILSLHLSIDNLASGHAARAREAIVSYLDEIRQRAGAETVQILWRRIWTGYLSLRIVASNLVMRLALRWAGERIEAAFRPGR